MKERAKKENEKIVKIYNKQQNKVEREASKYGRDTDNAAIDDLRTMPHRPSTMLAAFKDKISRSSSQGKLIYYLSVHCRLLK